MLIVLVSGTRIETEPLFRCPMFCGLCVEATEHQIARVSEQPTVYAIGVGPKEHHEISQCTVCGHVWGCDAAALDPTRAPDPDAPPKRARAELDAFLRAQATLPLDVPWTPTRIAVASTLVAGAAAVSVLVGWAFEVGGAAFGRFVGLVPAVLFAYHELTRAAFERDMAARLRPKLERLFARNDLEMRALAPRARQLGIPRLARLFDARAFDDIGRRGAPYR